MSDINEINEIVGKALMTISWRSAFDRATIGAAVVKALGEAGYVIVPKEPTAAMRAGAP